MENIFTLLGKLIGEAIGTLLLGAIAYYAYESIALAFNLPNLDYWACCAIIYFVDRYFRPRNKKSE